MKHGRRMLLAPEGFVKAMQIRNQVQTTPQVNGLTQLREQMDEVLADERLPAEIKTNSMIKSFTAT